MIEDKSDNKNTTNIIRINKDTDRAHKLPLGDRDSKNWIRLIPNIFTLLNLFFGCIAIVFALQTESVIIYVNDEYRSSFNIPEKLTWAAIFIGLAAIIDFFDGFVARLLQATSDLGKQLDSLSDIVS
nr:CDP-alcohol phosphatidyltransferase family protein [Chitinophagaceae bacterium]